jgi:hypothetical protein
MLHVCRAGPVLLRAVILVGRTAGSLRAVASGPRQVRTSELNVGQQVDPVGDVVRSACERTSPSSLTPEMGYLPSTLIMCERKPKR